ncbi:MAG: sigma-70 family RNA polymerase sigma factor [Nannocystaceae bacterium]|nr:sigma-70 family RNA polymerase sigma factor [Nannocystaceae bacterium]
MEGTAGTEGDWVAALRDPARRDDAAARMRDRLRRALGRSFGRQLSDEDLDDLTQDAVARALGKLDEFRGESQFLTWVTAIGVRVALGEIRKRKHGARAMDQVLADGREALGQALAPESLQRQDARAVLYKAIEEALTETQREALLAKLGGLSMMEIGRRTGRNRGALYKLMHDARKRLLEHLKQGGYGPEDLLTAQEATV